MTIHSQPGDDPGYVGNACKSPRWAVNYPCRGGTNASRWTPKPIFAPWLIRRWANKKL